MGFLLVVAIVLAGLASCAPQMPQAVAEPGNNIPAAVRAQQLLSQQLHMDSSGVEVVAVEAQTWPDACLGAPNADELCAQAQTPGYRVTLETDGRQYVYHSDENGDQVRLANAPEPSLGEVLLTWFGSDRAGCQTLEAAADGTAFGRCGRPLLGVPYSLDSRQADLAAFAAKYAPFEAQTAAGTIQFAGRGTMGATPAEQRMIAEWARLVYQEAEAGHSDPSWGVALIWHREGGLAGFCDELTIYRTGEAYPGSCGDQMPVDIVHTRLDAGQLQALYGWLDTFQSFEHEQTDPATADAMTLRLAFGGNGDAAAQDADKQAMLEFAQGLYNALQVPAGGDLTVCPIPAGGEQRWLDLAGGYCLLYPAEYSALTTVPGTTDLVGGSLLDHTQPRLSIRVEDAAGRSLDDVAAEMEADYVPPGWDVTQAPLSIGSAQGFVLDNLPGQDLNRRAALIHRGRLYTLFLAPLGDEGSEVRQQAEMLYEQVLGSLRFLDTEILIQLDYEGGFVPPEMAARFGRVPAFTLLGDGRAFYVHSGDAPDLNDEQLFVAQLAPAEVEALLRQVMDLGFEGLENHLDQCQSLSDGGSQCVADAGYSILRVRLADGQLREIRNWAGFANDPEALEAIRLLLTGYSHPEAEPYVGQEASLFIGPIPSAEGMAILDWPLDPGWLVAPAPDAQQWAGVLAGAELDQLIAVTSRNMGSYYIQHDGQLYHVVLVPWLPGVDYTEEVAGYHLP